MQVAFPLYPHSLPKQLPFQVTDFFQVLLCSRRPLQTTSAVFSNLESFLAPPGGPPALGWSKEEGMAVQKARQRGCRGIRGRGGGHGDCFSTLRRRSRENLRRVAALKAAFAGCPRRWRSGYCLGRAHRVVGCGRPAPRGFPVPIRLMCNCFRLQEEMLQREEAEGTLQSFRQVCRSSFQPATGPHPTDPRPGAILKVNYPKAHSAKTSRLCSMPPSGRKTPDWTFSG